MILMYYKQWYRWEEIPASFLKLFLGNPHLHFLLYLSVNNMAIVLNIILINVIEIKTVK